VNRIPFPGRWPTRWPLQPASRTAWTDQRPTYPDAQPRIIEAALDRAQRRPGGNWYVFAASRRVRTDRPLGFHVAGTELVAWRDRSGRLCVGPGACPHLGAPLNQATVHRGDLVCRWHGMRLGRRGQFDWTPLPSHDDGVLAWVRLDSAGGEKPRDQPVIAARPAASSSLDAVTTMTGVCEPTDVVANRLDPWHGAWFHPYSFTELRVVGTPPLTDARPIEDRFLVEVTFRVTGRLGAPVLAEFTCPEPRTVVMRITSGEGTGSVVETHATPLGNGPDGRPRTRVIEAIIATSHRPGFSLARSAAAALRPAIARAAARLWRDDLAYAERRYAVRTNRHHCSES
jgi:hypothetical protein